MTLAAKAHARRAEALRALQARDVNIFASEFGAARRPRPAR